MKNQLTAPAITHVMEPVIPGTLAVVTVGGAEDDTRVFAFRLANGPSQAPGAGNAKPVGKVIELSVAQREGEALTLDIPRGVYALLAIQTDPLFQPESAWIANRPRIDWSDYSLAECGRPFRLIGRNIVPAQCYLPANPENPESFGGFLSGKTQCVARRRGGTRNTFRAIPVTRSSCYEAHLEIPSDLKPGDYEIYVHNGLGGALGWSEPFQVTVQKRQVWPKTRFRVDDYLADTRNIDDAIATALQAIERNGGGILEFGAKIYPITRTIVVPRRTVLRGAGMDRTQIRLPTGDGPKPPYVAVMGDGDFVVEDLRIQAVHCLVLICAPCIEATTWEEGYDAPEKFGDRRAANVTVRRCHLETHLLGGRMRRKDQAQLDRVIKYILGGLQSLAGYYSILIRGTDVTIKDNVIHGSNCIGLKHIEHGVMSRNRLAVGAAGTGIFCESRLEWPANHLQNGGAPIKGRYSREILIEENEIFGASEFTRNLIMIYSGSENIHFARNHLHDIPPTTDGESFLTHLWPARWIKPRIRMTGPTTGLIIDPEGEVTNECLDGAFIDVIEGRGLGQLRRVIKRTGDRFEIEKPWRFDPDETSRISFSAPPPFRNMTVVDNTLKESPINIIIWGYSYDAVVDGNRVSDGPGITLWSVRVEAAQKVWGGIAFASIINNTIERDGGISAGAEENSWPIGITFIGANYKSVTDGYDLLGMIVRNNRLSNNAGIKLKITFPSGVEGVPWRARNAGLVIEGNHGKDSPIGLAVEKGAHVIVRNNTCRNVSHPVKWVDAESWWHQSI